MLIGLSGKFTSGKDGVASHLVNCYGFERRGFADKLKEVAAHLFGMNGKDRTLLQILGAKMREIDPDVWVRYVMRSINPRDNVVITDVRYQNEYDAIQKCSHSILIRLECPLGVRIRRYIKLYGIVPTDEQINHPSETDLDDLPFCFFINTDQPQTAVYNCVDKILEGIWPKP